MRLSDTTVRRLAVFGTVAALAVGALVALPALAQDATEEGSESTSEDTDSKFRFGEGQSAFAEALAEELDLPVDQVTEAIAAAKERLAEQRRQDSTANLRERLDEAVAEGQLTQEQADAILEAVEAGVLSDGPRGPGRGFDGHGLRRHGGMGAPHLWFDTPDDATSEGSATDTSA